MVGIMIFCMDEFLLSVLEQIDMGSFVGSFGGTGDGVGGPYVCFFSRGIMNDSDICAMKWNDSSYVSCKS